MTAIGEASRQSGVPIETIRYYEREGIVPKPGRASNGRRVYTDQGIGRLRFIKRCRDLGFQIPDAKVLLAFSEGARADCAEVEKVGTAHLAKIRTKIADLKRMDDALSELIANCQSGSTQCPMLECLKTW